MNPRLGQTSVDVLPAERTSKFHLCAPHQFLHRSLFRSRNGDIEAEVDRDVGVIAVYCTSHYSDARCTTTTMTARQHSLQLCSQHFVCSSSSHSQCLSRVVKLCKKSSIIRRDSVRDILLCTGSRCKHLWTWSKRFSIHTELCLCKALQAVLFLILHFFPLHTLSSLASLRSLT